MGVEKAYRKGEESSSLFTSVSYYSYKTNTSSINESLYECFT